MMIPTYHFTSMSIDGAGCSVLVNKFIPKATTGFYTPNTLIPGLLKQAKHYNKLLFTEIVPDKMILRHFLDKGKEITVVSNIPEFRKENNPCFRHPKYTCINCSSKTCTEQLYNHLANQAPNLDITPYKDFVDMVDFVSFHRCRNNYTPIDLHALLSALGPNYVMYRFTTNPAMELTKTEKEVIVTERKNREVYLDTVEDNSFIAVDEDKNMFKVIFIDKYFTHAWSNYETLKWPKCIDGCIMISEKENLIRIYTAHHINPPRFWMLNKMDLHNLRGETIYSIPKEALTMPLNEILKDAGLEEAYHIL